MSSPDGGFAADINVTPFVDVMLVLLIIFMVTAPMMTEGLDVDLPQAQSTEVLPAKDDGMVVSIKSDGTLFLDAYPATVGALDALLRRTVSGRDTQIFLRADKVVPYGVVMDVLGRIRAAGITRVGMVAESGSGPVSGGAGKARPDRTPAMGMTAP